MAECTRSKVKKINPMLQVRQLITIQLFYNNLITYMETSLYSLLILQSQKEFFINSLHPLPLQRVIISLESVKVTIYFLSYEIEPCVRGEHYATAAVTIVLKLNKRSRGIKNLKKLDV